MGRFARTLLAAFGLFALAACQAYKEPESRTVGEFADDVTIQTAIKRRLVADPDLDGLRINVDVHRGEVWLRGNVRSEVLKAKAVRLAATVRGVLSVDDQLTVTP